jgi:hypothetical protein
MQTDAELLILARAARRVGVPAQWLRAEADAGRVPCLRAGRRYLFELRALTRALAKRARKIDRSKD